MTPPDDHTQQSASRAAEEDASERAEAAGTTVEAQREAAEDRLLEEKLEQPGIYLL